MELLKKICKKIFSVINLCMNKILRLGITISLRLKFLKFYKMHNCSSNRKQRKAINKYWKKYTSHNCSFFQILFSSINGTFDVRYIPYDLYITKIDPYLNKKEFLALDNKCYYPMLFDCKMPKTLFMKINNIYYDGNYSIITKDEAVDIILCYEEAIFKPATVSGGGRGIIFWERNASEIEQRKQIEEILDKKLNGIHSYVVQEIIKQHPDLAKIHGSSVNAIRVITLLINNEIKILSSVLRMGVSNERVDNLSRGGLACGIDDSGKLKSLAFSASAKKYQKHPDGIIFHNYEIPSFEKALKLAAIQAQKFPYFRLIAWDIAIDDKGDPVLIEANFAKAGIDFMQYTNGPLFGEITSSILEEIF